MLSDATALFKQKLREKRVLKIQVLNSTNDVLAKCDKMSMVVEDLEWEEVNLNKTALTPRVPDPVNSNLEADMDDSLDREKHKIQQQVEHQRQDTDISPKGPSKGELSEIPTETTKKPLKRRLLDSVQRVAQRRYEKNAAKTIMNVGALSLLKPPDEATLGMTFMKDKTGTLDDDSSFDGHLFEYAMHVQTEPKVKVPRLHLKPTLKERAVSLMRRIFLGCVGKKQSYGYESSTDRF